MGQAMDGDDNAQTRTADAQIQREVLQELKWDARVVHTHIGVEVDDGMVVLTGHVDSYAERAAAQEVAHRVSGVHDVANDIVVKLPGASGRDDADLLRDVRHALENDELVPHAKIHATVSDGAVTLEGTLCYVSQQEQALRCIRALSGVRQIENLIVVETPAVAIQTLRTALEHALERDAVSVAEGVHLEVCGCAVILTGRVPSTRERRVVEDAVRATRGVKQVDNRLEVQSASPS
jgi:osmotically-inducible protein OsmY